jgi:hypothetical protein
MKGPFIWASWMPPYLTGLSPSPPRVPVSVTCTRLLHKASGDSFGLFYSGEERKSHRLFSGYLSLRKGELLTIYVEGLGVPPARTSSELQIFRQRDEARVIAIPQGWFVA